MTTVTMEEHPRQRRPTLRLPAPCARRPSPRKGVPSVNPLPLLTWAPLPQGRESPGRAFLWAPLIQRLGGSLTHVEERMHVTPTRTVNGDPQAEREMGENEPAGWTRQYKSSRGTCHPISAQPSHRTTRLSRVLRNTSGSPTRVPARPCANAWVFNTCLFPACWFYLYLSLHLHYLIEYYIT